MVNQPLEYLMLWAAMLNKVATIYKTNGWFNKETNRWYSLSDQINDSTKKQINGYVKEEKKQMNKYVKEDTEANK